MFSATSTYTNPLKAVEFFKKTGVDALAISYGTMHGASKGKNVKLRKEIAIAIKECMMHEGIFGVLVSHGSNQLYRDISWMRSMHWAEISRMLMESPLRN